MYRYRQDGSYIPLSECAAAMAEAGFGEMDLNFCKADSEPIEVAADGWEEWARSFREDLDRLGMTAGQSHVPFYRYRGSAPDYGISEYREEMIRRSLIASGHIGVKAVTFHSIMANGSDPKKNAEANLDYFRGHLALAQTCGVSIAIENMPFRTLPDGKHAYRCHMYLEELLELVDALKKDFDNVGICWDTGHANLMGEDQADCLRQIGSRLIATHINDNYGKGDDHLLPYLGTVDWKAVMGALREIGYAGSFSFEAQRFTMKMPDTLLPDALRFSVKIGRTLLGEESE